jgi:hypothetical protein
MPLTSSRIHFKVNLKAGANHGNKPSVTETYVLFRELTIHRGAIRVEIERATSFSLFQVL